MTELEMNKKQNILWCNPCPLGLLSNTLLYLCAIFTLWEKHFFCNFKKRPPQQDPSGPFYALLLIVLWNSLFYIIQYIFLNKANIKLSSLFFIKMRKKIVHKYRHKLFTGNGILMQTCKKFHKHSTLKYVLIIKIKSLKS